MTPAEQRHEELADSLTGLVRDVIMLHRPDRSGDCLGCDWGAYAEDAPPWPCRTVRLITEEMGL